MIRVLVAATLVGLAAGAAETPQEAKTPKQALRAFRDLIGTWRAAGSPEGTPQEKQKGFWTETLAWEWQFKDKDMWLKVEFQKGRHFAEGELRYLPEQDKYQLVLTTAAKEKLTFTGLLEEKRLILDRVEEKTRETHRLVFTLLHSNRFLYRYDVRPVDRPLFTTRFQVGATKEGVPFAAAGTGHPECVVSGGLGTTAVLHKGKTYYVCCSGCRDAFRDDPEKYIREFEEEQARKKPAAGAKQ